MFGMIALSYVRLSHIAIRGTGGRGMIAGFLMPSGVCVVAGSQLMASCVDGA